MHSYKGAKVNIEKVKTVGGIGIYSIIWSKYTSKICKKKLFI